MKTKSIVVAVDGSDNSGRAVQAAAKLADAVGCELKLLYVHSYAGYNLCAGQRRIPQARYQFADLLQVEV